MSLALVYEIWVAIKENINSTDRSVVADNIINILIDNDVNPEDIRKSFRGDGNIIDALKYHMDSEDWSSDEDLDEYEEDEIFYDDYDDDE